MRGRALELGSGRDDRRRPRLLLRVLARAAAGHPAHDRRLDRRRRGGVSDISARNSPRCSASRRRTSCSRRCAARRTPTATSRRSSAQSRCCSARRRCSALEAALEQIWGARELVPKGVRGWVRTRILSFGLILAVGFLLLVSLSLTTALAALRRLSGARFDRVRRARRLLDFAISIGLVTGLDRADLPLHARAPHAVAPMLWGALVTALLFHLGRWAIGVVPRTRDAAFGVRRRRVVRGAAAVAVLLGADLPARRGVHRLLRRSAR